MVHFGKMQPWHGPFQRFTVLNYMLVYPELRSDLTYGVGRIVSILIYLTKGACGLGVRPSLHVCSTKKVILQVPAGPFIGIAAAKSEGGLQMMI